MLTKIANFSKNLLLLNKDILFMKNLNLHNIKSELTLIVCLFLGIIPIVSTLVYSLYSLNTIGLILSFIISFFSVLFLLKYIENKNDKIEEKELGLQKPEKKESIFTLLTIVVILFLFFLSFRELFLITSTEAIISPWKLISNNFFIYYALSVFLLLFLIIKKKSLSQNYLILISILYFLSFSVCLISYFIGYGFDPFIHQATMEFISKHGFILPKNPYYLGQYGLIISLSKLTGISLVFLNKIFVPLLASLLLPALFFSFLKKIKPQASLKSILLSIIALLFIGFSPFIVTTPQNLSYLFLIAAIIFALKEKTLILAIIFSLATITIHPLSGIPAIGFLLFIFYFKHQDLLAMKWKRGLFILTILFNTLSLPLALFLGGGKNISLIGIKTAIINILQTITNLQSANQEVFILNLTYFFQKNFAIIITIIIIFSINFFFKKFKKEITNNSYFKFKALFSSIITLMISYFLGAMIMFQDVINYEQSDYIKRILILVIIFSLPFILLALESLVSKIITKNCFSKLMWLIFFIILILISLYTSHPRLDNYYNSRGFSISDNDLKAVQSIEDYAQTEYVVLANQQVSAAALKIFGFDHYLKINNEEIYFYPIPTGGKLYEYYLLAVYDAPSTENIKQALDFTGVDELYLVINKYWHNSATIINEAKVHANDFWQINNEVFIFRYLR